VKQTPKQFFASPAGKLTLAVIAMVLCWTVLIVYLSNTSAGGTWFPTEADMNRVRQDIKKDTNTYNTELAKQTAFEELQDQYEDSLLSYWNADRDGDPATELRNLINDAAQNAKANLQTLGSVRVSNINNELSYADLDFTVVDEYSKIIRFFAEVEKCTPRLAWRRVEIRLEPNRARAVTGPGARPGARPGAAATTAATTPTAQMFRTTGQVRVIKYSPAGNTAKVTTSTASKTTTASASKTTAAPAAGTTAPAAGATTPAAGATTPTTPAAGAATPAAARPATTNQPAAASAAATPAQQGPAANATTN